CITAARRSFLSRALPRAGGTGTRLRAGKNTASDGDAGDTSGAARAPSLAGHPAEPEDAGVHLPGPVVRHAALRADAAAARLAAHGRRRSRDHRAFQHRDPALHMEVRLVT